MNRRRIATIVLVLLPSVTAAEQLEFGVRTQGGWTNNVYGTSEDATTTSRNQTVDLDEVDDFSLRVGPWGKVSDDDGDFTWSARYQPSYEYYLDEADLRDFDHDAEVGLNWRVGERTRLFALENFRQYSTLTRFNENAGSVTQPAVLRGRRDQLMGSATTVGLSHLLTPRDVFVLSLGYNFRDFELSSDVTTFSLNGRYLHELNSRTSVGLQGSWARQDFSRSVGDSSVTNYYNLGGVIEHQFSRTLGLAVFLGPALIDPDDSLENFVPKYGTIRGPGGTLFAANASTCPLLNETLPEQTDPSLANYNPRVAGLNFGGCGSAGSVLTPGELQLLGYPRGDPLVPGSTSNGGAKLTAFDEPFAFDSNGLLEPVDDSDIGATELTYFASIALTKDWERWHATLSYKRASDESGNFGSSSVSDTIEANLRWEPAQLWTVSMMAAYSLIDQASDFVRPSLLVVESEPVPAGVTTVANIATVQRLIVDPDDNDVSYNNVSVSLTATRRLTERSSAFAALYWYQQNQENALDETLSFLPGGSTRDSDTARWNTLTLWLGVDWHFDAIKF